MSKDNPDYKVDNREGKKTNRPGDRQGANDAATTPTLDTLPSKPASNQEANQTAIDHRNTVTPTGSAATRDIVHADGRKEQVQVSHDKNGTQNYYVRNEHGELNQYKVKDNHTLVSDKGHELSLKTKLEPDRKQPESAGVAAGSNSPKDASRAVENPSQNKNELKQEQQKLDAQKAEPHLESQQKNLAEEKREKYPQVDPAALKKVDITQVKISESDRTQVRVPEGLLRTSNEPNSKHTDSLKDVMRSELNTSGLPANQNDKVKNPQSVTDSNRTPESTSENTSSKNLTPADRNARANAPIDSSNQFPSSLDSQPQKPNTPPNSIGDGHKDTIDKKSDTSSSADKNTKFDLDPKAAAALLAITKAESAKSGGGSSGGGGDSEKSDNKKADRTPASKPLTDDKSGSRGVGTGSDRGSDRTSKNSDLMPPDVKPELKAMLTQTDPSHRNILATILSNFQSNSEQQFSTKDQPLVEKLRDLTAEQLKALNSWVSGKQPSALDTHNTGDYQNKLTDILKTLLIPSDKTVVSKSPEAKNGKTDKPVAEKTEKSPVVAKPTKEMLERVEEALKVVTPGVIQCERGRPPREEKEAATESEDISEKIRSQRKKDRRTKTKKMNESVAAEDAAPVDKNQKTKVAESNKAEEQVEEQRARSGSDSAKMLSETATQKVFKDENNNVVRITKNGDLKTKYRKALEWWNEDNWHLVAEFKLDYGTGYLTKYKRNSSNVVTSRHYPGEAGLISLVQNSFDRNWKAHLEEYK